MQSIHQFKKVKDASEPPASIHHTHKDGKSLMDAETTGRLVTRPMAIRHAIAMGYKTGGIKLNSSVPPLVVPKSTTVGGVGNDKSRKREYSSDDDEEK